MSHRTNKAIEAGFVMFEAVLVVVVVAVIVGVGYYVIHNHRTTTTPVANSTTSNSNSSTPNLSNQPTAPLGTTTSIDQITEQDEQSEAGIDNGADSVAQQQAVSPNSAISNLGGAFNASTL